jgi:hypothetical protein
MRLRSGAPAQFLCARLAVAVFVAGRVAGFVIRLLSCVATDWDGGVATCVATRSAASFVFVTVRPSAARFSTAA